MSNTITISDLVTQNNLYISTAKTNQVQQQDKGTLKWAKPGDLKIDHSYQRSLNINQTRKIATEFDYKNMKPATGYETDSGDILITDGQHTVTAAFVAGVPLVPVYIHKLPAQISNAQALALQSKQFIGINKSNRPISKYNMYVNYLIQARADAAIALTDPKHPQPYKRFLDIDAMCGRAGVIPMAKATKNTPAGAMTHIKNLEAAFFNIGEEASEDTLVFLRQQFPNDPIDGGLYIGLVRFFKNMNLAAKNNRPMSKISDTHLFNALSKNNTISMAQVYDNLKDLTKNMGLSANTSTERWVSAAIRQCYNDYVVAIGENDAVLGYYC